MIFSFNIFTLLAFSHRSVLTSPVRTIALPQTALTSLINVHYGSCWAEIGVDHITDVGTFCYVYDTFGPYCSQPTVTLSGLSGHIHSSDSPLPEKSPRTQRIGPSTLIYTLFMTLLISGNDLHRKMRFIQHIQFVI